MGGGGGLKEGQKDQFLCFRQIAVERKKKKSAGYRLSETLVHRGWVPGAWLPGDARPVPSLIASVGASFGAQLRRLIARAIVHTHRAAILDSGGRG